MKPKATLTVLWIAGVVVLVSLLWSISTATSKSEQTECLSWQHDAKFYTNYFITGWQKNQCDAYNISIDAPVHE